MDEQSYCDHCLIVVGSGTAAEETLCKRRIAAGGRLAHLLTHGVEDHRTSVRSFEELDRCFLWQPPRGATSSFGKRLGPSFRTYWTKTGPDAVELEAQQQLVIFRAAGKMRHARILDEEGAVQAEMSGDVVLNPDMELAQELDVEVRNPELMACGIFSWRHMLLSMALLLVWHVARWAISIHFEEQAHEGQLPWWRGGLVAFNGIVFCCWGLFETWAASLAAERSTWTTDLAGLVLGIIVAVGAAWRQVADLPMSILAVGGIFLTGPTLLYYLTRARHKTRRFLPCFMWTVAQLCGTVGCAILLAGLVVTYQLLLADGQVVLATAFLPLSTAWAETGMVVFTKFVYSRLVVAKRPQVPGDTAYQELEAARARALAAGGSLPRAVEAAGSALEPLLRLRDVTGASCDLTLMPWLPQLLTVFRHVLRTAVGGAGSRSSEPLWATNADSGAGGGGSAQGAAAAAAAHAAAAAAAAISALGAPLDPSGAQRLECDALRVQVREQDSELRAAKQREEELRRELEELRAERRGLLHSASEGGNWFAKRVVDLERQHSEFNMEWQSVEVRVSELVDIVGSALEDHHI